MADERNALIRLLIELQDRISQPLERVQHSMEATQKGFAELGSAATEAFIGFEALKHIIEPAMAMQDAQIKLAQVTGATAEALERAKEQVEELSTAWNRSAEDLTAAQATMSIYTGSLESAEKTMRSTAQIANVLGVSADEAAKILGPAMATMGNAALPVGDRMQQVADKIAVLVRSMPASAGQSMARSLGQAAGAAKQLGIDMDQTLAAVEVLGKSGAARNAGTAFAALAEKLLTAGKDGENAFHRMGIPLAHFGNLKGPPNLLATLTLLKARGPEAVQAFAKSLGSEGKMFSLLMDHLDEMVSGTKGLQNAGGAAAEAAGKQQKSLSQQLGDMGDAIKNLADAFGTPLLAPLTRAVEKIKEVINTVKEFTTAHPAITGLATHFAGIVVSVMAVSGAFRTLMMGFRALGGISALTLGPWGLALAAVAAAAVVVYENFDEVKAIVQKAVSAFADFEKAHPMLARLPEAIGVVSAACAVMAAILTANPIGIAIAVIAGGAALIYQNWDTIVDHFQDIWGKVVMMFEDAWKAIKPIVEAVAKAAEFVGGVGKTIGGAIGGGGAAGQNPEFGGVGFQSIATAGPGGAAPPSPTIATAAPPGTGGGTQVQHTVDSHDTVTIQVNGAADPEAVARQVMDKLADQRRQDTRLSWDALGAMN